MLELRVLTPDDWSLWRELRLASLGDAPYAFGSKLADWEHAPEHRWRERLEFPWLHVAALAEDRPVGVVCGRPAGDAGVAELMSFWVAAEARGQNVATTLVQVVERWASERGHGRLRLGVWPDNARAIAFYRRSGFTEVERPGERVVDGRRELSFEKRLGRAE